MQSDTGTEQLFPTRQQGAANKSASPTQKPFPRHQINSSGQAIAPHTSQNLHKPSQKCLGNAPCHKARSVVEEVVAWHIRHICVPIGATVKECRVASTPVLIE